MKFLRIISNVIFVYVLIVCPTSCRTHAKVYQDINEKEDISGTIYNLANINSTMEVKNILYHNFSWKNVDYDGLDWYGRISIRFELNSEYGVENIRLGPCNLNESIRNEIIRCIKKIDFMKIMNSTKVKENLLFVFPFSLNSSDYSYEVLPFVSEFSLKK